MKEGGGSVASPAISLISLFSLIVYTHHIDIYIHSIHTTYHISHSSTIPISTGYVTNEEYETASIALPTIIRALLTLGIL